MTPLAVMLPSTAHIGTSGWNYKHWKETFYPSELRQKDWLSFYVQEFDTVEIDNTFYRNPTTEAVANWQAQVPRDFLFALKLWRGITHYRKLVNIRDYLEFFLDKVDPIRKANRAPLLVQLPPQQRKDLGKLTSFLEEFHDASRGSWPVAVEFRHDDWLTPDTYRVLDRFDAALCLHDMRGRAATNQPNEVNLIYLRRHGSSDAIYSGSYSDEQIAADANRICGWLQEGRAVFAYYNNDIGGHAIYDARRLRERVQNS